LDKTIFSNTITEDIILDKVILNAYNILIFFLYLLLVIFCKFVKLYIAIKKLNKNNILLIISNFSSFNALKVIDKLNSIPQP